MHGIPPPPSPLWFEEKLTFIWTQIFSPIKGPLYLSGRRAQGTQHDINIEAATNKFGNVVFLHNSKYIYSMYMN